jgi:hypothetical protein
MDSGNPVELLAGDAEDFHIGFGIHVGTARLPGQDGHFTDNITFAHASDGVQVAIFFHPHGAGAALNDITSVSRLPLIDKALAGFYFAAVEVFQNRTHGIIRKALKKSGVFQKLHIS